MRKTSLRIIYEDENLLVVNKPAGLLTSTNEREKRPTLLAKVREYVAGQKGRHRVGLIHRLDRDAAGLLVFSKNNRAYESLKEQLFHRNMKRRYLAIVQGIPKPDRGRIESRLIELADGRVVSTKRHAAGERAITDYEVVKQSASQALVRITLLTGRKHQIRVHFAERGHPIVGDQMYAGKIGAEKRKSRPGSPPELKLCAAELAFDDPITGKPRTFTIDPAWNFA
jgi:23S rRNA pseudouridine1911/1915/1917 synthase